MTREPEGNASRRLRRRLALVVGTVALLLGGMFAAGWLAGGRSPGTAPPLPSVTDAVQGAAPVDPDAARGALGPPSGATGADGGEADHQGADRAEDHPPDIDAPPDNTGSLPVLPDWVTVAWDVSQPNGTNDERFELTLKRNTVVDDAYVARLVGLDEELLRGLIGLDLARSPVTSEVLPLLATLPNLTSLSLWDTRIGGRRRRGRLGALADLHSVTRLDVGDTNLDDDDLALLADLTQLRWLRLSNNPIYGPGLVHLRNLHALESLELGGTPIEARWYGELVALANLTHVSASGNFDTASDIAWVGALRRLRSIRFSASAFRAEAAAGLTSMSIRHVKFDEVRFPDSMFRALAAIPTLDHLELWYADLEPSDGLEVLLGQQRLRTLLIKSTAYRWALTDADLGVIARCASLQELKLSVLPITAAGLEQLSQLPQLRRLNVEFCDQVTDEAVPALAAVASLEHLTLRRTALTDEGVARLRELLPDCEIVVRGS